MDIAAALGDLVSAKQKEVDLLNEVIAEVSKPAAPVVGDGDQLAKLQAQIDAKVKECDQLRAAVDAHFEDEEADRAKLKAAIAPIEAAPVPEVPKAEEPAPAPEAPAADPAPAAPEPPAADPAPAAPEADPAPVADDAPAAPKLQTLE